MIEYFYLFPVILGWLTFFSAVGSYVFYCRHKRIPRMGKLLFTACAILCFVSALVWAIFRNL